MITINTLIQAKKPVNSTFTDKEKQALLEENKNAPYSYLCLLREILGYSHTTVNDLLRGWGGVQLVNLK